MRRLLFVIAFLAIVAFPLFGGVAWADPLQEGLQNQAQGQGQGQLQGQQQGQAQGQLQGQAQGQGQQQKAVGVGVGVGVAGVKNSGSTVSTSTTVNQDTDVDPPAYAPDVATFRPTVNCKVPIGGSAGAMGLASLGFQTATTDESCVWLEKAVKCSEAMKQFAHLEPKCRQLWDIALLSEDEQTAALEQMAQAREARHVSYFTNDRGEREQIAWATARFEVEDVQ